MRGKIDDDTPVFTKAAAAHNMAGEAVPLDARPQGTSCLTILETHFQVSNPLFKRRSKLLKLKPTQGEQFTSYTTRLKETSEECDLHNISHQDVILLIATMHCNKEELRKDIKRYRNPTWLAVEQLAENYERSMVDEEPHKVGQVKRQDNKKKKKSNNKYPNPNTQQLKGKCFRCGSTGHKSNDCKLDRTSKCLSCGKAGHLTKVCLSSPPKESASAKKVEIKEEINDTAPDTSESCRTIIVRHTSTEADAPPAML